MRHNLVQGLLCKIGKRGARKEETKEQKEKKAERFNGGRGSEAAKKT